MELPDRHYPTNATLGYQNDWTVSQKAPKAAPLFRATPREREAALAALGTRQAIKQARKDKHLLFEAILQHNHVACRELIQNAALLDRHTSYGAQPLGLASAVGDTVIVSMLLEAGANLLAADGVGATALINASYRGHTEVVKLLLESKLGGPGGRAAMLQQCTRNGETALMAAAKGGHTEVLQVLLSAGANVHLCDSQGRNALMLACKRNKVEAMHLLLSPSVGLSPDKPDLHGRTPLMHAASGAALQAVQALLALQPAPDLSARDLCPPGHAWLPRHTINTTYTPSAAAAAAQASAHLGSSPAGARARPALSPSPPLGPDARVQPAPASHAPLHGHTPSLPQASWLAGSSPSPRARRATVIPHPPVSSPSSPISRTVAAKAAACAKVDLQKQADQEGKGGWGVRAGCTKQQQVLEGKKQQQQQSQRAGDAWGSLEGVRTCEAVWDIPLGRTALEHAAACTCAPDARTLQVLAEAGERQVAAARASCTGVGRGVGGSPPLWGAAHSPAHGSGAGQEHGDFTEGSAQGCVPVALSDSMVDMQQQQHPQPQQHQEHELEQEHAAVDIRHPQAHSLGAKRSSDTGGVHRGGARVWGSGMVADPLDIEGGARLLWLAAEAGNLAAVEWLLKRGVGVQALVDVDHGPQLQPPLPTAYELRSWGSPATQGLGSAGTRSHGSAAGTARAALLHHLPNPVFAAVYAGSEAVLDALIRAGARVDARDGRGRTPLAWAACHGQDDMVLALVARGASLTAMDLQGNVPRQLAYVHRRASTAQLLARMAKQQLLVDDSCIEEEREIEQRNTVVVPEY